MKTSTIELASTKILDFLDFLPINVYRREQLASIFYENAGVWGIAKSVREKQFINFLIEKLFLTEVKLSFPNRYEVLYVWRKADVYEMATKIRSNSFFSHITAAKLHGLISTDFSSIYLNKELAKIRNSVSTLDQSSVDRAFKNHPRVSKNIAEFKENKFYLLYSKNHNRIGVEERKLTRTFFTTDLERTLIDVTVRPFYSRDLLTVFEIFTNSGKICDPHKILNYLRIMDFKYPYHQSIGFLMEKSGFPAQGIAEFEKLKKPIDFYLDYQMVEPKYSKKWRLFYPAELERVFQK